MSDRSNPDRKYLIRLPFQKFPDVAECAWHGCQYWSNGRLRPRERTYHQYYTSIRNLISQIRPQLYWSIHSVRTSLHSGPWVCFISVMIDCHFKRQATPTPGGPSPPLLVILILTVPFRCMPLSAAPLFSVSLFLFYFSPASPLSNTASCPPCLPGTSHP